MTIRSKPYSDKGRQEHERIFDSSPILNYIRELGDDIENLSPKEIREKHFKKKKVKRAKKRS